MVSNKNLVFLLRGRIRLQAAATERRAALATATVECGLQSWAYKDVTTQLQ